jgi:ABC-2 type transport system ATP-binding protein
MLQVRNVYKNYKNKSVLKGVDFSVKTGEIKALIGVNGSGKTTLIEIVCGVKTSDRGEILVNQINNIDKKRKTEYRTSIGYMMQHFGIYNDLTVKENLEYMCAVYGVGLERVDELIKEIELIDYVDCLAENLSGGYRQLLSFACSIVHKPKLMILDEPTSAMDPIFRKKFWKYVKYCQGWGATVLIITHFIEELLECDSFACLSDGKICFDGKVKDFKKEGFVDIEQILMKFSTLGGQHE